MGSRLVALFNGCQWTTSNLLTRFTKIRFSSEIMPKGECSHLYILPRNLIPIFTRISLALSSKCLHRFPSKSRHPSQVPVFCLHQANQATKSPVYLGLFDQLCLYCPPNKKPQDGRSYLASYQSLQEPARPAHRCHSGGRGWASLPVKLQRCLAPRVGLWEPVKCLSAQVYGNTIKLTRVPVNSQSDHLVLRQQDRSF